MRAQKAVGVNEAIEAVRELVSLNAYGVTGSAAMLGFDLRVKDIKHVYGQNIEFRKRELGVRPEAWEVPEELKAEVTRIEREEDTALFVEVMGAAKGVYQLLGVEGQSEQEKFTVEIYREGILYTGQWTPGRQIGVRLGGEATHDLGRRVAIIEADTGTDRRSTYLKSFDCVREHLSDLTAPYHHEEIRSREWDNPVRCGCGTLFCSTTYNGVCPNCKA